MDIDESTGITDTTVSTLLAKLGELRRSGNQFGEASLLLTLGTVYYNRGEFEAAEERYSAVERFYRTLGDSLNCAIVNANLGMVFFQQGRMELAEEKSLAALAALERSGNQSALAGLQATLGAVYHARGELATAKERYRAAESLFDALGDSANRALMQTNLGMLSYKQGDLQQAEEWSLAALAELKRSGNQSALAGLQATLGAVYHARGELTTAEEWYRAAESLYEALGDSANQALMQTNLGMLSRKQGNTDEADADKVAIAFSVAHLLTTVASTFPENPDSRASQASMCLSLPSVDAVQESKAAETSLESELGSVENSNTGNTTISPKGASIAMSSEGWRADESEPENQIFRRLRDSGNTGRLIVFQQGAYRVPTDDRIKEFRDWLLLPGINLKSTGAHCLHDLLEINGRPIAIAELAVIVTAVDILSNIIRPGAQKLKVSLLSLTKVAKAYGLPHRPLRLPPPQLTAIPTPLTVHLKDETYVTVYDWTGLQVSYRSLGRPETEDRSSFLDRVTGVALADARALDSDLECKVLSDAMCAFVWG